MLETVKQIKETKFPPGNIYRISINYIFLQNAKEIEFNEMKQIKGCYLKKNMSLPDIFENYQCFVESFFRIHCQPIFWRE